LESRIEDLTKSASGVELILAMNPNTPGETTALYLKNRLATKTGITITRLGRGLASGAHLEYADESTLKHALEFRK
ncbi:MAG: toprim domain-containing protein, partial [Candidatus Taylorbacteria bacterium]|nr:toprim domain-containing protein [Candidatus Taylorbacteria bacterium]